MLYLVKNGHKFLGVPIILGLIFAWVYPYPAFQINTVIYYLLFGIMLFASLIYDFSFKSLLKESKSDIYSYLFFGFFFMPALQWALARALLSNLLLQQGLFYASLSPIAIVAPHFVKLENGRDSLSYQLMLITTLFSPILFYLMTLIFGNPIFSINLVAYIKDLTFLCIAPIFISFFLKKILKKSDSLIENIKMVMPSLNFICIGLITYTLMGTMLIKVGLSTISTMDLCLLFILALIQDFGTYFIGERILPVTEDPLLKKTLLLSVSIKNVALTGGLLLFYSPIMAFAASACLIAHAFFFLFISFKSNNIFLVFKKN